ncbi:MAG: acyl-CoA carboxylase subunit epsilon [Pseudonocardiaceae bacterium]
MSGKQCYDTQRHSRVIHSGGASDEEVAAVIAVLAGVASADAPEPPAPRSAWADPSRRLRTPLHPGPGAWRCSALPP